MTAKAAQAVQNKKSPAPKNFDEHEFGRSRSDLPRLTGAYVPGRVSVIIPCYNNEEFVGDAIESALKQTWRDVEIIVVDDGSSDRGLQIISSFGDRVRSIPQNQQGASAARNNGIAVASGEFIQFLDADDVLLTDSIKRRIEAFGNDGVDAVFGDVEFVDSRLDRIISTTSHCEWPGTDPLAHLIENNICTEGPLHRRMRLFEIGGFDEGLPCSQEFNLHIRLLLHGARFEYLGEVVARAREHSGQSRIENAPWFLEDPELHLRIMDHHRQLIARSDENLLSPTVRSALALKLWSRGMIAGRNGAFDVARLYFRRARSFASPLRPGGSTIFRLIHSLLGPSATTWLLFQKQRVSAILGTKPR